MTDRVTQIVRGVPSVLKDAIRAEVEETGGNMNDVVVGILAKHFDIAYEGAARRSGKIGDSPDLVLRMPPALHKKIKVRAASGGTTQRDLIVAVLSERYGTRFARSGRRAAA